MGLSKILLIQHQFEFSFHEVSVIYYQFSSFCAASAFVLSFDR